MMIGVNHFDDYPVIDREYPIEKSRFIDSILMHHSYLESLGGDYDGDTVSLRSVWSQEANKEADEIINSVKYISDMNGNNIRVIRNEAVQTLFALTK